MSAVTASLCSTLLFIRFLMFVSAGKKTVITAESGQDVTLTCQAPNNKIKYVHWSRADLTDKYVLLYQDGQFDPEDQHPSFKNRVDLQDRQMKDGDVSLILKDVNSADSGTYVCRVFIEETRSWKNSIIIHLHVVPPEKKTIKVKSGQDVTLTCRAPNNKINSVHWSRADLTDKYVLLYQDGQFVPEDQHPSFMNRVDLQDRQMKDGDVSLILKDVNTADSGTYVCRVFIEETHSWKNSIIIHLHVDPPDQKIITAESGQDVTLTCRAPNNKIKSVHWSRADLTDKYVLLYQDGQFVPYHQHPSFKNRVDLQDRQVKDGDVSLILKDVNNADSGTYVCHVFIEETRSWKISIIIHLHVVLPGQPDRDTEGEGKVEEGKKHEVKKEEGKKEEGKKHEVKKEEGKNEEGKKDEGKRNEGKKHEVKKEEGKKEEGKKEEGKRNEGKKEEGKKDEGKRNEGKTEEGKKHEVKKEEGKKEEGKRNEGKKKEVKKHEVKKEQGKMNEEKKHEVKKEQGKMNEEKKHEVKKEEGKRNEVKKEEGKKEEGRKDGGENDESVAVKVLLVLLVAVVVFLVYLILKKIKTAAQSKKKIHLFIRM